MQLLHNNTSTTSGTSAFACVYSVFACVWYFCICTCMHNYINNTWWLWLLVAAFCAWDSKQPPVSWLPPMALDKMFHVQWATISNIQACLFREMWMVDRSCTGKQSTDIDWWQCRAATNNAVQMVLDVHGICLVVREHEYLCPLLKW